MKLERLYIQGFKSFKDRTTIQFDNGITGIVGPNGCGKSNIVDALFWVMGEQSAKHLRGTKMSDLIFSGSKKYSPASFAEVTLVLSNTDKKHIHIGSKVVCPSEIQLTRKLYKSGDTEYKINNTPARLKDIQEVFMDTGAGAKSYSIIAQGEIDRLVKAKPVERRVMIEEVAGITKFKARKKESLRKIDQTNANLERINDLKKEIHKNLKSLEAQSEKAEKAKSLKEKIKRHSLIVDSHKEHDFLEKINEFSKTINELEEVVENSQIELETLNTSLESERNKQSILTDDIEQLQSEYNEGSLELVSCEEKLTFSKSSLLEKQEYIEEKKSEIETLQSDIELGKDKFSEIKETLASFEQGFQNDSGDSLAELEEEVNHIKEELTFQEEKKNELESNFKTSRQKLADLENEKIKVQSELDSKASAIEMMSSEIDDLEGYYLEVNSGDAEQRKSLDRINAEYEAQALKCDKAKQKVSTITHSINDLKNSLAEIGKNKTRFETKKETLEEKIQEKSMKEFTDTFQGEGFSLLKDLIEVKSEYQSAITSLLGPYFNLVIGPENKISKLSEWAKNQEKNLEFLTTCTQIESFAPMGYKRLDELVSTESEEVRNFLSYFLLSQEGANTEEMILDVKGSKFFAAVDISGKYVINTFDENLLVKMSFNPHQDNFLKLKEELQLINDSLSQVESEIESQNKLIETSSEELNSAESEYNELSKNLEVLKENKISIQAKLNSESHQFKINEDRLSGLKKKTKSLSEGRFELTQRDEEISEEVEQIKAELEGFEERVEAEVNKHQELSILHTEKLEKYLEMKSEYKSLASRKDSLLKELESIEKLEKRNLERMEGYQESITQNENSIEEIQVSQEEYTEKIESLTESLKEQELKLSEQKDELAQLLLGMQEREKKVGNLRSIINKSEKEAVEKRVKVEKMIEDENLLSRNVFDLYKVDLRKSLSQFLQVDLNETLNDISDMYYMETNEGSIRVEGESYEFSKRFPGQVKESSEKLKNYKSQYNRLGSINWQAVEDYDKQKVRYDFLKSQEEELNHSINDLMTAIVHIDEKSKERFQIAYDEVNSKFTQVFPIIFGGGSATLKLVGDLNTDDFGVEIIASPPGKKMQNINLMSGGEKALTAVALIFSIFLVKPSPFCLLDEVDAPLDDANVGRFNQLLREMSHESQFILITHNKKTMELNDRLYGITMQEPGVSKALSVQLH